MSDPLDRARLAREVQGDIVAAAKYCADKGRYSREQGHQDTAAEHRERARLWRVALAAVRADIKKRGTQRGRR